MGRITYEEKFKELEIPECLWEKVKFIVKTFGAKPEDVSYN